MNNVTYILENKEFEVENIIGTDAFGHFSGEKESKIMTPLSDLRLSVRKGTENSQEQGGNKAGTRQGQDGDKTGTRQEQDGDSKEASAEQVTISEIATKMERVRSFIPERPLLETMEARWAVFSLFELPQIYKDTNYQNFEQFIADFEKGNIKTCPKPIVDAVNELATETLSRKWYTNTLELFIEYRKAHYPPKWVITIDRILDRILHSVDYLLVHMI